MPNKVSLQSFFFWMDETEVTVSEYKQFVYWVRDSISRQRHEILRTESNEAYKIEEDRENDNPIKPYLNWSRAFPWKKAYGR